MYHFPILIEYIHAFGRDSEEVKSKISAVEEEYNKIKDMLSIETKAHILDRIELLKSNKAPFPIFEDIK